MAPEQYGAYRIFEPLGTGGMATVYRAEMDTPTGVKEVALKRLVPTLDRKPVALFLDEARLLKYMHHPNIPELYASGRVFGTYFMAMEYIKGPTLKQVIEHCASAVGPVPQAIVLNLMGQLCDALGYAHKLCDEKGRPLGIIHRDVTPTNLILDPSGLLKLVDFGMAKANVATEPSTAGVLKGKLGYVAPEYTRGSIDHRADLWAAGIIMYELLTARRLFDGAHALDTISRVREMPVPRPSLANPKVSKEVDEITMTALERNPSDRWTSAASMATRIRIVSERLGEQVDNQRVIAWVQEALEKPAGSRAPQPTPMAGLPMVMPVRAQTSPITNVTPQPPQPPPRAAMPPAPAGTLTPRIIVMCAVVLVVLAVVVWKLVS